MFFSLDLSDDALAQNAATLKGDQTASTAVPSPLDLPSPSRGDRTPGRGHRTPSSTPSSPSNSPMRIVTPREKARQEQKRTERAENRNRAMAACAEKHGAETKNSTYDKGAMARVAAAGLLMEGRTHRDLGLDTYRTQQAGDPLKVSDLNQQMQATLWNKRPLYYTHHRKSDDRAQMSQELRLPPMHRHIQFSASEGASWERIADNAFTASQKFPGKKLTIVVLLYCTSCNPFHLGDVDVLKRAKAALDTLEEVAVVGAVVVPSSEDALVQRGADEDRRLPFEVRRDLARSVLETAQQDKWVVVDTCLEGCMKHAPGADQRGIAPFVSVYARGRLHGRQHDIRVVEVLAEDAIDGARVVRPYDQIHVCLGSKPPRLSHGPDGSKPGLNSIGTLVVEVPKQSQCDDLMWSAVKQVQDRQFFQAMERFCGLRGAKIIVEWTNSRSKDVLGRKNKLLNI